MSNTDRILSVLADWKEEAFAYSCEELATRLGLETVDVQLALACLENTGKVTSAEHKGVVYYASRQAQVEHALLQLVREGKVEVEEGPKGELRYRAAQQKIGGMTRTR